MSTSTKLVPADNVKEIRRHLEGPVIQAQIHKAIEGLTKWVSADKLVRVALTAIQSDENLMKCDPVSIVASVIQLAQVGLVPDGFLGQAYLVPFWNKARGVHEAEPMIGYRGYGELAIRSGKATSVDGHVVYEGDVFEYEYGSNPFLRHKITLDPKKRGQMIGAYAIVYMKEGPQRFDIMTAEEIFRIRNESKSYEPEKAYLPWNKWFDEMARKTPMRRLAKWVPLSPEFQMAAGIDENSELGKRRTVLDAATGQVFVVPEGAMTESAPNPIERPTVVQGTVVPDPQPQSEQTAATKTCLCSCCKSGSCDCASKEEFERCGCTPCKTGAVAPVAQTGVANPAQPAGSDLFPEKKQESEPEYHGEVKKLMAISRSVWPKDYEAEVHKLLMEKWGIDSLKKIPKAKYGEVCEHVNQLLKQKASK